MVLAASLEGMTCDRFCKLHCRIRDGKVALAQCCFELAFSEACALWSQLWTSPMTERPDLMMVVPGSKSIDFISSLLYFLYLPSKVVWAPAFSPPMALQTLDAGSSREEPWAPCAAARSLLGHTAEPYIPLVLRLPNWSGIAIATAAFPLLCDIPCFPPWITSAPEAIAARFKPRLVLPLSFRAALPPAWPHRGCTEPCRAWQRGAARLLPSGDSGRCCSAVKPPLLLAAPYNLFSSITRGLGNALTAQAVSKEADRHRANARSQWDPATPKSSCFQLCPEAFGQILIYFKEC